MPKISLWNDNKTNDYNFIDKIARETIDLGGTAVYLHRYIGPASGGGITTIDDFLFLENRNRIYDDIIYELRGHYNPQNSDYDLTPVGLFISSDILFIEFHINEMVERIGRKIISGDVIELPHLREYFTLNEDDPAFNKFYVVEETVRSATGYGPRWWPHIWRVKCKIMSGAEEFSDILGDKGDKIITDADGNEIGKTDGDPGHGGGDGDQDIFDNLSTYDFDQQITNETMKEAALNVPYDPVFFTANHFYVYNDENGYALIPWRTGDGIPPNGIPLLGSGDSFPDTMKSGEYFLRIDFDPPALYLKDECRYVRIEVDMRRCWTAQHKVLDKYIDNKKTFKDTDGNTIKSKQPLSKLIKAKNLE